ncbi:MAG: hypothetical protein L3J36_00925 [Rhodobacteraceae bacterium]|nr:hypothetical protein [Paracoccaceae bacterium]
MSIIDVLAAKLAEDSMKAMDETGDERLYFEVGNLLAASSQSLEEAYLTEVRVRLAERLARKFLVNKVKTFRAAKATDKTTDKTPGNTTGKSAPV